MPLSRLVTYEGIRDARARRDSDGFTFTDVCLCVRVRRVVVLVDFHLVNHGEKIGYENCNEQGLTTGLCLINSYALGTCSLELLGIVAGHLFTQLKWDYHTTSPLFF